MAARGVAKRYAQAVFELARETGTEQAWLADLTTLANAASDPSVGDYFTSPNVSEAAKRGAIDQIVAGADHQLTRNLAYLLIERRRFDILPEMLEVYRDLLLRAQGRPQRQPHRLDGQLRHKLSSRAARSRAACRRRAGASPSWPARR